MSARIAAWCAPRTAAERDRPVPLSGPRPGWMPGWAWAQKAGDSIVDLGTPLEVVETGGDVGDPIGGYSILQADSDQALAAV